MKVEIKLIGDICLKFNLSSVRYRIKNNILAERTRKPLILKSDLLALDTVILPTKYTKFIEVYTAEGKEVTIDKEFPTRLSGNFTFVIKKKTIDIKKTIFFEPAYNSNALIYNEVLLENLEVNSYNLLRKRKLQNSLNKHQNIIHFGSKLQFETKQSKKVEVDIQDLIIFEEMLSENKLKYSKYVLIEITKANMELFFGANKKYISDLLINISKKRSVFVYTDIPESEHKKFTLYEKLATAVLYEEVDLMQTYIKKKTKSLKIDAGKIKTSQLEYTLNSLSKNNIVTEYSHGITVRVDSFEQLIHAIIENLNDCLCHSMYLNLETNFELTIEQQNVITAFKCENITVNSSINFEYKELTDNVNRVLANSYPKYTNANKDMITDYLSGKEGNQTVVFVVDSVNPITSVIDGYLIVKMDPKDLGCVLNAYEEIEVLGYNNELIELLYNVNAQIYYNVANLSNFNNPKFDVFARQMWKIIGMSNLQFKFLSNDDYQLFNQRINIKQIALKYSICDVVHEDKGSTYFEIENQQLPIVIKQTSNKLKITTDAAFIIKYHNDLEINTIDLIFKNTIIPLSSKTLLHLPVGSILDCKGKIVSLYCTGNQYNPNEFKKYRNEAIVNSTISGEFVEKPNCGLEEFYTNYAGIYIDSSELGQMFATNITLENKDRLNQLYNELLKSDKYIYILADEESNVTNIITTYNTISNLKLSVFSTQDEVYSYIKKNKLWKFVEVIR